MIQIIREMSKQAPRGLQKRIERVGGSNIFGEPNFKMVWGWSRLSWMGGKWHDGHREVIELRREPKYMPFDRWHIEKWMPPEIYGSPSRWSTETSTTIDGQLVEQLGPYPSRGEYEHCFTIQKPDGSYADPFYSEMADFIVRAVMASKRLIDEDKARVRAARQTVLDREQQQWDSDADAILSDTMPAFGLRPRVAVPHSYSI